LINFTAVFQPGIYALLGPNGAGKTTLINILVDNLQPDSGQVLFDWQDTHGMGNDFRRLIGYMPQQQQMYQSMTTERFLYYMSSLKGLSRQEATEQIDYLLELLNLVDRRKIKIGTLSGGMKQRVLIAQALLGNPSILIFDEPTAGLDPKERVRMRRLVERISDGRIILFATHVVSDVESIADKILFLRKGELIAIGGQAELVRGLSKQYEMPVNPGLEDLYMVLFGDE